MIPLLEDQIAAFFRGVSPKNALVFTTFGLDEAVLVRLLAKHKVNSAQRIVVYHEIMKHRNPGLLQAHYENSKVISVEIAKKHRDNVCPIFHSKIWMEVVRVPFQCVRLAVLSANLTRYHLDAGIEGKTCETFSFLNKTTIKLPPDRMVNRRTIFDGRGKTRVRIMPATFVIDDSEREVRFLSKNEPVHNIVMAIMKNNSDQVIGCAAPFVNKTPVQNMTRVDSPVSIWTGERRDGTRLHAKIVETKKFVITGSPNITKQAYGLTALGIINHEALFIAKKSKSFSLAKALKGFTRVDFRRLDDYEKEPDADYDGLFNWAQQKEWAVHGPDSVSLVLNERTGKVEISIKGTLDNAAKMTIHNFDNGQENSYILECPPRKHLKLRMRSQQQKLVDAVLRPPVLVKGIRGNKIIWVREMNLSEFWKWIENNISFVKAFQTKRGANDEIEKQSSFGTTVLFDDVRELRLTAYRQKKTSVRVQLWHKWICEYSKHGAVGQGTPRWCIELGKQLRRWKDA